MPYHFLTDSELVLLQRLLDRERGRTINAPTRDRNMGEQSDDYRAPDIYIAKPTLAIPALASSSPYDKPGKAVCDIYKIVDNGTDDPTLQPIETTQDVYNISTNALDVDTWLTVMRDKHGSWVPAAASSGIVRRSFILRTDLEPGGFAVAQETEFRTRTTCDAEWLPGTGTGTADQDLYQLCWKLDDKGDPIYFWVFDRLQEFWGYADRTCGIAWRLPDTPTMAQFCMDYLGLTPTNEEWGITDPLAWEIMRMVCSTFTGCPCEDPDVDPCSEETPE